MGRFSRTLVVLSLAGWFSSSSTGCSCVPTTTASSAKGKSNSEQPSANSEPKNEQPQSGSAPSSSGAAADDRDRPSKTLGSESKPNNGGAARSSGAATGSGQKEQQKKSGLGSVVEGLFGKSNATSDQMSPRDALDKATSLEREANNLEKNGRKAEAFERALEAWQLVRVHDQDTACCRLAQRLEPTLERLGEAASTNKSLATGKPLRIQ
jgi:hypothetical protein